MSDKKITIQTSECISCKGIKTRDWHAWNNRMPPEPDSFHIVGYVRVGNPGIVAELRYREPQGINHDYLLLDLFLVQRPGVWPEVVTWVEARYDQIRSLHHYTNAEVFCEGESIAAVKVEDIH